MYDVRSRLWPCGTAGGITAFDYALEHPERVISLVVANTMINLAEVNRLTGGFQPNTGIPGTQGLLRQRVTTQPVQ